MKDKQSGKFVKEFRTTEERLEQLGIDCYELMVLQLVIRKEYVPAFAVKVVKDLHGVEVNVRELYHKLTVGQNHEILKSISS
jgi:hypothetical protein